MRRLSSVHYLVPADNLFIALSSKRTPVGSEEFQDGVVLYRDEKSSKVIGVEIMYFKMFKDDFIQIAEDEFLDMTQLFKIIRTIISIAEISSIDRNTYESLMRKMGWQKSRRKIAADSPQKLFDNLDEILPHNIPVGDRSLFETH